WLIVLHPSYLFFAHGAQSRKPSASSLHGALPFFPRADQHAVDQEHVAAERHEDRGDHETGRDRDAHGVLCRERRCEPPRARADRSEEHTSELQSRENLVCRLLLEKKKLYIGKNVG